MVTLLDLAAIAAPTIQFQLLLPVLCIFGGVLACVLVEATTPMSVRPRVQLILTVIALVAGIATTITNWLDGHLGLAMMGSMALDGPTYFAWSVLLIFGIMSALMFGEHRVNYGNYSFTAMAAAIPDSDRENQAERARFEHTEIYPLMLLALGGMMVFISASDLLTLFVALEVFSLPLYLLTGLSRRRRLLSQEAAIKYFILGALGSAIMLYGIALVYGFAGTFDLRVIDAAISNPIQSVSLALLGVGMISVGLMFKIGVAPFHAWVPDVYTGAPTPVTGFMAICTKLAAVVALTRVLYVGFGALRWSWQPMIAALAVLTMLVGAILTVVQTSIKRMLAWSAITHAGFILVGIVGAITPETGLVQGQIGSVSSVLIYLAGYGLAVVGAFSLIQMVRRDSLEAYDLKDWAGVGRRNPVLGVMMSIMMLSFAGIPLTAGFVGKLTVFVSAWRGGYSWLVLVSVVASVIAAFAYFRWIIVMFVDSADNEEVEIRPASSMLWTVIALAAVLTVVLGVWARPMIDPATFNAWFMR